MISPAQIQTIAAHLLQGSVVALPTETIYGLCCDPRQPNALQKLFALKERDPAKPVLCITGQREQIDRLVEIPAQLKPILEQFWPGPLTVVLPLKDAASLASLTTKTGTIALRHSSDPLIRAITALTNFPIVATSANKSGEPFLQSAAEVRAQFGDALEMIIKTDHPLLQIPSTIIACSSQGEIILIREGAIPWKDIADSSTSC